MRSTGARLHHGADYNYEQWLASPEILNEDFVAMKKAGITVMTVGIFSWSQYEAREGEYNFSWMKTLLDRLHENNIAAILATPSGSKPAWMSKAYPEICRVDRFGRREKHGGRHNHCRTSPIYRDKCKEINTLLAKNFGSHPALELWHVSNEYNAGRCYCEHCLNAFRSWLEKKYKNLEALNAAWWTSFWSHTFSAWDEIYPDDTSMNGMMLDWARFTSDQTLDFFKAEAAPLRELSPHIPITTNFMTPDVGIDYFKLARELDIVSWDSYPRWHTDADDIETASKTAFVHDLYRSCKQKPFLLMESTPSQTNWQGISPLKRPGMHLLASVQALAHGADSVQYFQWRQSRGGEEKFHGAVMTHFGGTDTRVFAEVTKVGKTLEALAGLAFSNHKAEVALVYDFNSSWALDLAQLPNSMKKNYLETCMAHYKYFWAHGLGIDIIDSSVRDVSKYKLIVMPMLYMLETDFAETLEAYVTKGGCLVASYLSGLVDEHDLCYAGGAPGPLSRVFGLRVEDSDAISTSMKQSCSFRLDGNRVTGLPYKVIDYADYMCLEGAETLAVYKQDFLAGLPMATVNHFGQGRAWYLGARTDSDFLEEWYTRIISDLGLKAYVDWKIPSGVSVQVRETRSGPAIFVLNFSGKLQQLDLGKDVYKGFADNTHYSGILVLKLDEALVLTRV